MSSSNQSKPSTSVISALGSNIQKFRRYVFLAVALLSLKYSRGRFIYKNQRLFLSFPNFINTFGVASGGWFWTYIMYLFTNYHPKSSIRRYDVCSNSGEETELYTPSQMKVGSKENNNNLSKSLPNGDHLVLTDSSGLKKMKDELISIYDQSIIVKESIYREEQLVQLFDSLPAVDANDMISVQFDGFVVPADPRQALNYVFPPNTWSKVRWGKVYSSKHFVDPVVVNYEKRFYVSMLSAGNACVNNEQFRDKVTATMAYDNVAVKDFFAQLRPKSDAKGMMLLGMFMLKDKLGGFFLLKEDKNSILLEN